MEIELQRVPFEDKSVLANLFQLYLHDHSEYDGEDVNEHGLFGYKYLDHYWVDEGRHPFVIRVGGRIAGFAIVCLLEASDSYEMAEFFVMRNYRRSGVGRAAAVKVFDMFSGKWSVAQMPDNLPSQSFWRKVIGDYTGDQFENARDPYHGGPMQVFNSVGSDGGGHVQGD